MLCGPFYIWLICNIIHIFVSSVKEEAFYKNHVLMHMMSLATRTRVGRSTVDRAPARRSVAGLIDFEKPCFCSIMKSGGHHEL